MNVNDYSSEFPSELASPNDAVEAIVDKFPTGIRNSRFQEQGFVEIFRSKIATLIGRFPLEPDERKPLEIDLAHIFYRLSEEYGINISGKGNDEVLRALRAQLVKEGLLTPFTAFSRGETEKVDLTDPRDMRLYLEYLYGCSFRDIRNAYVYVDTCVRLSQIPDGSDVFHKHLDDIYEHIDLAEVEKMLEENDYLGGTSLSDHVFQIQEMHRTDFGEELSTEEAEDFLNGEQIACAKFHIFLNHIVVKAISPLIGKMPKDEQKRFLDRLNDFRDIVDPEMYVPASFKTGNTFEDIARVRWQDDGREVH